MNSNHRWCNQPKEKLYLVITLRVPRSLLPGGRSSRLRDRQRVPCKKAFVEGILSENRNLSVLLQEPGFRLVVWDPDLLPRHNALAVAAAGDAASFAVSSPAMAKNELEKGHSEMQNKEKTTLLEELSLFMEKLNDVYYDDDDGLLNDFQVDSGTLACVACGVLGFPFMSVLQPSEKALKDLSERQGEIDAQKITTLSSGKSDYEWNTSSRHMRPRIFCTIEDLAEIGSTNSIWTVDLAYLLHKFCVEFSYFTITFGANPNYSIKEFYKEQLPQDLVRVDLLFRKAHESGIIIQCRSVTIHEISCLLLSGNYIAIALVDQDKLSKSWLEEVIVAGLHSSNSSYTGHYIVICGYDAVRDEFEIRDPASSKINERISSKCLENVRKSFGTDEDLLLIKLGDYQKPERILE